MCALQPEPPEPSHCKRWMGQTCQGMWFSVEAMGVELCQRMLCNLLVFATSELSSHETTIHQCTDDNYGCISDRDMTPL